MRMMELKDILKRKSLDWDDSFESWKVRSQRRLNSALNAEEQGRPLDLSLPDHFTSNIIRQFEVMYIK